ncbi:hypothetical protein JOC86_000413 [Bacillus pakistanensis]|uniref:Uncharacterized protein n=1 Tax=Rossellomorea pakistanensis TaxID=992288 RepID=A0ABS2N7Q2_9BACI|nr:hypothetical protein [Bacillus pakistanensis]
MRTLFIYSYELFRLNIYKQTLTVSFLMITYEMIKLKFKGYLLVPHIQFMNF